MTGAEYRALVDSRSELGRNAKNAMITARGIASGCEGCGGCCGRVIWAGPAELARLAAHVRRHGVKPVATEDQMCALLDPDTRLCMAYAARPLVCRVWDSPAHGELVATRPGQPCGCRADRAALVAKAMREMREVDTWELFGVSLEGSDR